MLANWPKPYSVKQYQKLVGFVNFLRKFVPNVSEKLKIFMVKNKTDWTNEMDKSLNKIFKDLKENMLFFPLKGEIFNLAVDASNAIFKAEKIDFKNESKEEQQVKLMKF